MTDTVAALRRVQGYLDRVMALEEPAGGWPADVRLEWARAYVDRELKHALDVVTEGMADHGK